MSDIIIAGSYIQDLSFKVDQFPLPGETKIGAFNTGCGGKGFNQAVAASRQGVSTFFIGKVGKDSFGEQCVNFLAKENNLEHLVNDSSTGQTGTAAILVNAEGENSIVVYLGANDDLSHEDIPDFSFIGARVAVTQLETNIEATKYFLKTAKSKGLTTILNTAPMRKDFDVSMLEDVDTLILNETEFKTLLDLFDQPTAPSLKIYSDGELKALCEKINVGCIILTLGSQGSFVFKNKKDFFRVQAYENIEVVDTTGAGDAFVGGLAAGLIKFNFDYKKAVKHATAVAALAVTKKGTAPSMPKSEEVEKFISAVYEEDK